MDPADSQGLRWIVVWTGSGGSSGRAVTVTPRRVVQVAR